MAIMAMMGYMRTVNVAELKNQLSKYLRFAKGGEEIVIRDRNLPVAKLVPFPAEEGTKEELLLVAAGKMRLPKSAVEVKKLLKIPTGKLVGREGTQALLEEREQSL
jgi:prevent-host-death family protein